MIGIFDSGLGGLSVLRALQRQLPNCDVMYFGDTAGGSYESKSPELTAQLVTEGLSRLAGMGADLLLVADHSASACLTADVRNRFTVPLFDILTHGVVPGAADLAPKSLGILGPPIIEAAGAHRRAIGEAMPETRIFSAVAPLLSPLVDAGWLKKPETVMITKKYLHFFKLRQIDALVMGSNHYALLTPVILRKIGKKVALVDAVSVLAREVNRFLAEHPDMNGRRTRGAACRTMVSDLTDAMKRNARMFYGKNITLERI